MTISRMSEWGLSLALLLVLAASGCGGNGSGGTTVGDVTPTEAYAPAIDPSDFTGQITNQYFPLTPGTTFVFEGTTDGVAEHNEVTVTRDTKIILGVTCVVVHDVVATPDGEVTEDTFDWYAQDNEGNVWYFGEDTKEYENGAVSSTAGSWEAGVDGAQPGIVMKASPAVGDSYRQEYYAGEAEDMAKVIQLGASADVTAGPYQNVLVTEESSPLSPDQVEHKYYAPGVGFVKSSLVQGGSEETQLVRIDTE